MAIISRYRGNVHFWLKGYLFLGVAVLVLAMFIYSNHLINRMEAQSEATTRLFSRFIENVQFELNDEGRLALLHEVMSETKLPIILTVLDDRPIAWRRVPVADMEDEDFQFIREMDPKNPPAGKFTKLMSLIKQFDEKNKPIPVKIAGGATTFNGHIHFGMTTLQKELRFMPFVQLGLFLVFMGVAIQGLRYLKISEQRSIWVGMAKETAHQLGTPLSALLGWVQLMKDKVASGRYDEVEPSIREMEVDLARLGKVTERFSKIGSQPELINVDLKRILERTVSYFHLRLPRLKSDSTLSLVLGECPDIKGNEELLEWVFENLVKNALDALGDGGGIIEIRTVYRPSKRRVEVFVKDTGKGIPAAHREQIFRPGFTTKKRGWGLGLALTQRIVEDYHNGTLKLLDSRPGKGTTFVVRLPAV
jgi:signal transduction histidine kinase